MLQIYILVDTSMYTIHLFYYTSMYFSVQLHTNIRTLGREKSAKHITIRGSHIII